MQLALEDTAQMSSGQKRKRDLIASSLLGLVVCHPCGSATVRFSWSSSCRAPEDGGGRCCCSLSVRSSSAEEEVEFLAPRWVLLLPQREIQLGGGGGGVLGSQADPDLDAAAE